MKIKSTQSCFNCVYSIYTGWLGIECDKRNRMVYEGIDDCKHFYSKTNIIKETLNNE